MARIPTQKRQVRFNLPLSRQNTAYNEAESEHIPNLTEEQMDIRDEESVEKWLCGDGSRPQKASTSRLQASAFEDASKPPMSLAGIPGSLPLQLVYGALEHLNLLPPDDVCPSPPPPPPSQPASKLKRFTPQVRDGFIYHKGAPLSFHYSNSFFNEDEQEYVVPATSDTYGQELRIRVTRDWSERKLSKHREDQLLIYRVPRDDAMYFGITVREFGMCGSCVRKPQDEDDRIHVVRHGHPSWDIGYKDEMWYLIGKNSDDIGDVLDQIDEVRPTFLTRLKKMVLTNTLHRIVPPSMPGILS